MTLELERVPASSAAGAPRRLTTRDRDALRTFGLLVLSVWITVSCTGWLFPGDRASKATPYVCLSAPIMVVLTVTFASGRWAG